MLLQGGLEVDGKLPALALADVGGRRQDHGSGHAEMRKEQFAKILVKDLALGV